MSGGTVNSIRYHKRRRPRYGHLLRYFELFQTDVVDTPDPNGGLPVRIRFLDRAAIGGSFQIPFPAKYRQPRHGADEHHWFPLSDVMLESLDHELGLRLDLKANAKNLEDACDLSPPPTSVVHD